jgi:ABC-type polysaccharide/polyol phosphate export permease
MSPFSTVWKRREMLVNLVSRELKARYKGSVLGFLWSILTPLFMAFIYMLFLRLLARGVPMQTIIIGVFAWQFTAQSVNSGLTAITGNSNLVRKVFFPRIILPISVTLANLVNYLLSLIVQFVILYFLLKVKGETISIYALALPLLIIYHTVFNMSLAFFLSGINVYFRDAQHLVGVLLSAWFFVSPAMYDLSFVQKLAINNPIIFDLYMINPMAIIITGYRALLLPSVHFHWTIYTIAGAIIPLLLFYTAYRIFQWLQRDFADML